jgi:hypothetical protein
VKLKRVLAEEKYATLYKKGKKRAISDKWQENPVLQLVLVFVME